MIKKVVLQETNALLWFPEDPKFNNWLYHDVTKDVQNGVDAHFANDILMNWSNKKDQYCFYVWKSRFAPFGEFWTTDTFKFIKSQFPSAHVRANHLIIDDEQDIVMFKLLYADGGIQTDMTL